MSARVIKEKTRPVRWVEAEGKTTQEAIKIALLRLGVTRDKVIVKLLSEERKGLYGMKGARGARVKATLKEGP